MGNAAVQGELWGGSARDWAMFTEQNTLPLIGAVLDAGLVRPGVRLLDVGCGSGLALLMASLRGANVAGVDAAENLLTIAGERVPEGDVRQADMESLPFESGAFDVVIAINSVFHGADMVAAGRELVRVTSPGGRVVVTSWGPSEECESRQVNDTFRSVLPSPPPPSPERAALTQPGGLKAFLEYLGLRSVEEGNVACQAWFPTQEIAWRSSASGGPAQDAIRQVGEDTLRTAVSAIHQQHTYPDGSVRYQNVFKWAVGVAGD